MRALSLKEAAVHLGMSESSLLQIVVEQVAAGSGVPSESNWNKRSEIPTKSSVVVLVLLPDGEDGKEPHSVPPSDDLPVIDEDRFSIWWRGKETPLGNTERFTLVSRLIHSRGRKVLHLDICDLLDNPQMSPEAIRSAISKLRKKLPPELASRITSGNGFYLFD